MKIGTLLPVTTNSDYRGQDMNWTETFTGEKIIGKGGELVYHSSDMIIKDFMEKEICAHPSSHSKGYFISNVSKKEIVSTYHWKTYLYSIFLPEGTIVRTYSDDEYRFELIPGMKIVFTGTIFEAIDRTERKITKAGLKEITLYKQYSDVICN